MATHYERIRRAKDLRPGFRRDYQKIMRISAISPERIPAELFESCAAAVAGLAAVLTYKSTRLTSADTLSDVRENLRGVMAAMTVRLEEAQSSERPELFRLDEVDGYVNAIEGMMKTVDRLTSAHAVAKPGDNAHLTQEATGR